jgi:hypothetical protein
MLGNNSPGQEHYQKQFPAQLWLHGGCPYSGNALDIRAYLNTKVYPKLLQKV